MFAQSLPTQTATKEPPKTKTRIQNQTSNLFWIVPQIIHGHREQRALLHSQLQLSMAKPQVLSPRLGLLSPHCLSELQHSSCSAQFSDPPQKSALEQPQEQAAVV